MGNKKIILRNHAPIAFSTPWFEWTAATLHEVEEFKESLGIPETFPLLDHLKQIPKHAITFDEGQRQQPRPKEKRDYIDQILKAATKCKNNPAKINTLKRLLQQCGSKIISILIHSSPSGIECIRKIRELDEYTTTTKAPAPIDQLICACKIALKALPVPKKGRPENHASPSLMDHLVRIYVLAVNKEPTHGRDSIEDIYIGDCYKFVKAINDTFLVGFGLDIKNEHTLSKALARSLKVRRDEITKNYSLLLTLTNHTLVNSSEITPILIKIEIAMLELRLFPITD